MQNNRYNLRHLIITADDMGMSESINRGILYAARNGLVNSVSVMPNGCAFKSAVSALLREPELDIGVHLTLVVEKPICSYRALKGLVCHDGHLPRTWTDLCVRLATRAGAMQAIEIECRAQIERVLSVGLHPIHLNSHQHVHLYPPLWRLFLRLAQDYRIPWVRGFRGSHYYVSLNRRHLMQAVWKLPLIGFLQQVSLWNCELPSTVSVADATLGILESGHLNRHVLTDIIRRVPVGISELICHPGYADQDLKRHVSKLGYLKYQWAAETSALTSDIAVSCIQKSCVRLGRFRDMATTHASARFQEASAR